MTLPLDVLRNQHPDFNPNLLDRYRRIYEGGQAIQERIEDFLPKGRNESLQAYHHKSKDAFNWYENHVANIINNCDCELFAYPFDIRGTLPDGYEFQDPDSFYAKFKEDCTSTGVDLKDFMRSRFTDALIYGNSYFILHFQDGLGSLEPISPLEVIDWQYTDDQTLEFCVIRQVTTKRPSFSSKDRVTVETFRIFEQDTISTYRLVYACDKPPANDVPVPLISKESHSFNIPPVLCLHLPSKTAIVPTAGDLQIGYFQHAFGLSYAMKQTNYPLAVAVTDNPDDISIVKEIGLVLSPNSSFTWATPDPSSFEQQVSFLKHLKDEIYRVCNATSLSIDQHLNGSVARSGESKQIDAAIRESGLNRLGAIVRETVQALFNLLSEVKSHGISWDVTGLDRFAIAIKGTSIQDSLLALDVLGQSSKTARLEIESQLAEKVLAGLPQHQKFRIRAELETASEEPPPQEPNLVEQQISQLLTQDLPNGQPAAPQSTATTPVDKKGPFNVARK